MTCYSFFDLIHSFSATGENVDFLLSKNNTGRLPRSGILPVKTDKGRGGTFLLYFCGRHFMDDPT